MNKNKTAVYISLLAFSIISLFLISSVSNKNKVFATTGFVSRQGTKFYFNNRQFNFVGFNIFDSAATNNYQCASWTRYTDQELDSEIKYMKSNSGATVLRFWAFQKYTNGGTDFSGIDKIINIAKQNDIKLMPVLENGQQDCSGLNIAKYDYKNDTWYSNGYKVPFGSDKLSYRDYVKLIVNKYKNESTILGWTMMNEADTSTKNAAGKTILVDFATDIASVVKSIDNNHLLTVGTQSNGASGGSGQDFIDLYSIPTIDFTEGHDWGYWGSDTDPLPGSSDGITLPNPNSVFCLQTYQNKIACSIAQSIQILNKPFVMGESGMAATDITTRRRRADLINNKMNAAFANGVSGYLIWQFNKVVDTETFDVLSSTNDPIFLKMKTYSIAPLTNIIINSSFEGTNWQSPWIFEIKSILANGNIVKDSSTFKVGSSSAKINITKSNGTDWHVQFRQENVSLSINKRYTISFWAKASNTRSISSVIQKNYGTFTELSNITSNLNTNWQYYSYDYTPILSDNNLLFTFNVGNILGSVWIDDARISY